MGIARPRLSGSPRFAAENPGMPKQFQLGTAILNWSRFLIAQPGRSFYGLKPGRPEVEARWPGQFKSVVVRNRENGAPGHKNTHHDEILGTQRDGSGSLAGYGDRAGRDIMGEE